MEVADLIEWYANGQPRTWEYRGWEMTMFGAGDDWAGRAKHENGGYVSVRRGTADAVVRGLMENIDQLTPRPFG